MFSQASINLFGGGEGGYIYRRGSYLPGTIPPRTIPPPQLLTPSGGYYIHGRQAAGTHPTGMHPCLQYLPVTKDPSHIFMKV